MVLYILFICLCTDSDCEMYNKKNILSILWNDKSNSKPEEFNFKDTEVLEGKEYKPWFEELM